MMKGFGESQAGGEVALGILLGKGQGALPCWNRGDIRFPHRDSAEETPGRSKVLNGGDTMFPDMGGAEESPGRSRVLWLAGTGKTTKNPPKMKVQRKPQEGAGCSALLE